MNNQKLSTLSGEEKKEYIKELTESMLNAKYIITNCEMASKFNKENLDIINIGILMYSLLSKESNSKDVIIEKKVIYHLKVF